MNRIGSGALLATAVALLLGACDSTQSDRAYPADDPCHQLTSCGTCTPIAGCGWCFNSNGAGTCASSPDECTTLEFSWTWEPSGCRVGADASVAGDAAATDAGDAGGQ